MEGNLEIFEKEGYLWVSVNPKIYSLDVVYSAAYMFIDDCYVLIEGDPEEEIIVELRPKVRKDLKLLGNEFNNELVKYATYEAKCAKNAKLREFILRRVLLTNDIDIKSEIKKLEHGRKDQEIKS
ncbi:MAG: hypothetical protein QW404_00625 [Candidatus Nanoarchaeia archaeon]